MARIMLGAALLGLSLMAVATPPVGAEGDPLREAFAAMDSNGDGVIGRDEFELNKVNVIFRRSPGRGAKLKHEDTLISRATFDAIDLDGDGEITASDIREASIFKFDAYDRNGDNLVDFAELRNLMMELGREGSSGSMDRR